MTPNTAKGPTAGPWTVEKYGNHNQLKIAGALIPRGGFTARIAIVGSQRTYKDEAMDATLEANARLIAAAPALLAMVERYASECGECGGSGVVTSIAWAFGMECDIEDPCEACADIRAALNLAKGV